MKKQVMILLSFMIALSLLLTACGGSSSNGSDQNEAKSSNSKDSSKDKIIIKLAHTIADTTNQQKGAEKFKEIVEQKTNGQIEVQIFPSGQLGQEREIVDGMKINSIQMGIISAAGISNFAPKAAVLGLPYVIKGETEKERYETLLKLSKTDAYKEITDQMQTQGIISFPEAVWWYGNRHVTTKNKPIEKPEDLKGIKIRTPDAQIHTEPFKIMGANVTPMSFSELYMALQTGAVDAQENPINTIYTSKFYEVQKYVNLTGHMTQNQFPVISLKFWESLSPEFQQIIHDACVEAGTYQSELQIKDNDAQLAELEKKGMIVVKSDQAAFKEATKDTYKAFEDRLGEGFYEKIIEAQQ